jgi:hypothetical protein
MMVRRMSLSPRSSFLRTPLGIGRRPTWVEPFDRPQPCAIGLGDVSCRRRMAGERILIVEDDERIRSSLLRAMVGTGYDAARE